MSAMNGKVVLVTGANSGLGKATALGLAKLGAKVVMVCRSQEKGEIAQKEVIAQSGSDSVDLLIADLSSQQSICQFAEAFKSKYRQLHVLVNNAAVNLSQRSLTVDGLETTFAVNHLAPFLLTNLLLDVLKASAPARIINVTSSAQSNSIDFDNLQAEKGYNMMRVYAQSKLENSLFTYELARRLEGTGVTVNCVHPGIVRTNLGRDFRGFFHIFLTLMWRFMSSPEEGAAATVYLASSPAVEGVSSQYFGPNKQVLQPPAVACDEQTARRLWQVSVQLTRLTGSSAPA